MRSRTAYGPGDWLIFDIAARPDMDVMMAAVL
jgi:hypothetical protein